MVIFELIIIRGAVKKDGVGLGWGSRAKWCHSAEQEERQAMLQVFKEIQEEKLVVNEVTNLKYFGKQQCNLTRDGTHCWHTRLTINSSSGCLQLRTNSPLHPGYMPGAKVMACVG